MRKLQSDMTSFTNRSFHHVMFNVEKKSSWPKSDMKYLLKLWLKCIEVLSCSLASAYQMGIYYTILIKWVHLYSGTNYNWNTLVKYLFEWAYTCKCLHGSISNLYICQMVFIHRGCPLPNGEYRYWNWKPSITEDIYICGKCMY